MIFERSMADSNCLQTWLGWELIALHKMQQPEPACSLGTFPGGDCLWVSRLSYISCDYRTLSMPAQIFTQSRRTCILRAML
jgi:hypothetical protein